MDIEILLYILEQFLGITGPALAWFRSYLTERLMSVIFNGKKSSTKKLLHGVPQGSVLGPLLFRIYLLPFCILLRRLGLTFHLYADDTEIYIPFSGNNLSEAILSFQSSFKIITDWLSAHCLKINDSKTELILIGPKTLVDRCKDQVSSITLGSESIPFSSTVKNLGVTFDETLSFRSHISQIRKSCFSLLLAFSKIRNHFSRESIETLIHALVTSKLDYCNSLFAGSWKCDIQRLQSVQNFAARIILRRRKYDHVSPLELHWLPIEERINFKILMIAYKCLNFLAPDYLASLISYRNSNYSLRSVTNLNLEIPLGLIPKPTFGRRAFSFYAPYLWNDLPIELKSAPSLDIFKKKLKTFLFQKLTI